MKIVIESWIRETKLIHKRITKNQDQNVYKESLKSQIRPQNPIKTITIKSDSKLSSVKIIAKLMEANNDNKKSELNYRGLLEVNHNPKFIESSERLIWIFRKIRFQSKFEKLVIAMWD